MSISALLTAPKPLTMQITTNWKILQEMGIPDHLTCHLRNLYAGQEATVRTGHGTVLTVTTNYSNYCFLTCVQISQEAGKVVRYSHLLKNFPQFVVNHTVNGFGVVNKAGVAVFLELSCFFYDPTNVGNLISGSAFSKSSLNIWKFTVDILFKPGLENFEHYFTSM